jgi:deoxycytidylate deaminase
MSAIPDPVVFPELIFGIAGPIGVDMDGITKAITDCLKTVRYGATTIKLTNEMTSVNVEIEAAKKLLVDRFAYVIRQLKHPEEVKLLRQVYGRQFILISAYASEEKRHRRLLDDIKASESTQAKMSEVEYRVRRLMERDASEIGENLGQQLRETFHLADVFIDGVAHDQMKMGITRFIDAFFGKSDIAPRKDEYGMYAAKSASLRSSDLSRQVGAAIFSKNGHLLAQGCNEVPKAGGGIYSDGEFPDHRDIKKGFDPNDRQKRELLRDIIERLRVAGLLSSALTEESNDAAVVEKLIRRRPSESLEPNGPLADSWIMDLTEFGRVVHAEMCAICDAAREGISIKQATLYCTTFPCHNCTKHIIASGLSRVVYMEPYPKSRAKELHEDEIQLESETDENTVSFVPFMGISPNRYRDIFQKGRRKSTNGEANAWLNKVPTPMLDIGFPAYTVTGELWALGPLIGDVISGDEG